MPSGLLEGRSWNLESMSPIALRGSLVSKICRLPWWSGVPATIVDGPVRAAGVAVTATTKGTASFTTSVTSRGTVLARSMSSTRGTVVSSVGFTSAPTSLTWLRRAAATRIASSPWPCAMSWRTTSLTERPPGASGATIESLSRLPRSRTGSRRREKKSAAHAETDYLDWALADFSGYVVADELYDGPFCVLSAVDGPKQRRLIFEVLDHDPDHGDIRRFLIRLKQVITARGGRVRGVT